MILSLNIGDFFNDYVLELVTKVFVINVNKFASKREIFKHKFSFSLVIIIIIH